MRMNTNIPMSVQPVNVLGAIDAGNTARFRVNEEQHRNALRPLELQQARQNIQLTQEQIGEIRRLAKDRAAQFGDMERLKAERDRLAGVMNGIETGDPRAIQYAQTMLGIPDAMLNDPNGRVALREMLAGTDEVLAEYSGRLTAARPQGIEPTADMRNLEWRAEQAGLVAGTPEYQEFMRTGGGSEGPLVANYIGGEQPSAGGPVTPVNPNPPKGAEEAFGLEGFVKAGANAAADFVGLGEVFPNAAEQRRFFRNLEEDMLVGLSQAYGRQPAMALMERLRKLLPNVGTIEGSDAAFGELVQMEDRFRGDLVSTQRLLDANPRMNQSDRQQLRAKIEGLSATLNRIQEARMRFTKSGGGADVSPDDVQLMEQLLNDG